MSSECESPAFLNYRWTEKERKAKQKLLKSYQKSKVSCDQHGQQWGKIALQYCCWGRTLIMLQGHCEKRVRLETSSTREGLKQNRERTERIYSCLDNLLVRLWPGSTSNTVQLSMLSRSCVACIQLTRIQQSHQLKKLFWLAPILSSTFRCIYSYSIKITVDIGVSEQDCAQLVT